jgi:hypothetical protein
LLRFCKVAFNQSVIAETNAGDTVVDDSAGYSSSSPEVAVRADG